MAEAQRPDGFRVLSLGYAEGPLGEIERGTLLGTSQVGLATLLEDIRETEDAVGFRHYLTDALVALPNSFVRDNRTRTDTTPPSWSARPSWAPASATASRSHMRAFRVWRSPF